MIDGDPVQLGWSPDGILPPCELVEVLDQLPDGLGRAQLDIVDWRGLGRKDNDPQDLDRGRTDLAENSGQPGSQELRISLGAGATDLTESLYDEMRTIPESKTEH